MVKYYEPLLFRFDPQTANENPPLDPTWVAWKINTKQNPYDESHKSIALILHKENWFQYSFFSPSPKSIAGVRIIAKSSSTMDTRVKDTIHSKNTVFMNMNNKYKWTRLTSGTQNEALVVGARFRCHVQV